MLSRLAFRNAQVFPAAVRALHTTAAVSSNSPAVNEQRPVRRLYVSPVRHGFIPEEWFTFFYPKTGASGPYVFLATFGTYLVSKEIYVLEHEFYNGLSFLMIWIVLVKKFGPAVSKYLTKENNLYEKELNDSRDLEVQQYEETIKEMKNEIWSLDAQKLIFEAKRENIFMQLEATYRERLAQVSAEVKKRLNYHAQIDTVQRRIAQKHMVQWIINNVLKSITPDQEKANLQQCIKDLEALAVKA